jgi:hypothetical protein
LSRRDNETTARRQPAELTNIAMAEKLKLAIEESLLR